MTTALQQDWPALRYTDWADTCATLHMWTQVVGKIRMALTPPVNHWWHVPLYVSARGLTTSPMPLKGRNLEVAFDFIDHRLDLICSDGRTVTLPLRAQTVAEFHRAVMRALDELEVKVRIWTTPCEVVEPIPFEQDLKPRSYDPTAANRFWRVLSQVDRVFKLFRGRFLGKASPVHFFWGSFDLAVTRFSGRPAPRHPGSAILPASVSAEAYSHEVSSAGFWPGDAGHDALFYAYAYPEPRGFRQALVRPRTARWDDELGEFVLPYEAVRVSHAPEFALLNFLTTTYEAAADLGDWPRDALERRHR
jgi:hypothetical protein